MKHAILDCSDDQLLELIITKIQAINPRIKIGERLPSPTALVWKGKLLEMLQFPQNVIRMDFQPPHYERPAVCVEAKATKIHFDELDSLEASVWAGKWLYPFKVTVPHRQWLWEHVPGDTVMVLDDQHDASPLTLTEQHFKDHSYMIFRFAISD